ncbi:MAG: tRNA (adenosine(37)-N6)-dimethylallyltransferase MiaA [Paludibacteraceae bacterium]|nr:tRNA (adenosine(37)-N6)-dimethylallyltransferase MiaA [Paludibacteraceae bacterium]
MTKDNSTLITNNSSLITILGPTASGKTTLATHLALHLNGEIISADSRQIYRGMDLGTGKDLCEYTINGKNIPYHLIDIHPAGYKYNLYEYQRDFLKAYDTILQRGTQPILCGGTGLYIEAILGGYRLLEVPVNEPLRHSLEGKSLDELSSILDTYPNYHRHNQTDVDTVKRAIRAIEIADYYANHTETSSLNSQLSTLNYTIIGVDIDRELRREKITRRLKTRLDEGMLDEVQNLLNSGIHPDDLIYYGLEYKFLTQHLIGELTFDEMFKGLETAIHQFAKRQMTWFRGMERRGYTINWINADQTIEQKVTQALEIINKK